MHRFYLPPEHSAAATLMLAGREAHHARDVLRVRQGERVMVVDGAGQEILCEVQNPAADCVHLTALQRKTSPVRPGRIALLQAVPKGKIFESIIQKATELGVARIVPLLSARATARLDEAGAVHKAEKWQWVAIEALKQCGSPWLPKIETPIAPQEFLARREHFDLSLIASLQPGSRQAREYFHEYRIRHGRLPESLCLWIGPEGDFTPEEITAAEAAGALPITLGRLVLRVETAAISCLAILNYELASASSA